MKTTASIDEKYGPKAGRVIRRYLAKIANHQRQIAALKVKVELLKTENKLLKKRGP